MDEQIVNGVVITRDVQGSVKVKITYSGKYVVPEKDTTYMHQFVRAAHTAAQDIVDGYAGEGLMKLLLGKDGVWKLRSFAQTHREPHECQHSIIVTRERKDLGNALFVYVVEIFIDMQKDEQPAYDNDGVVLSIGVLPEDSEE